MAEGSRGWYSPAGVVTGGADVTWPAGEPHSGQKWCSAFRGCPFPQLLRAFGSAAGAPHSGQNLAAGPQSCPAAHMRDPAPATTTLSRRTLARGGRDLTSWAVLTSGPVLS